jgi:hypothetical protein
MHHSGIKINIPQAESHSHQLTPTQARESGEITSTRNRRGINAASRHP